MPRICKERKSIVMINLIGSVKVKCDACENHCMIVQNDSSCGITLPEVFTLIRKEGYITSTTTIVDKDTHKFSTNIKTFCSVKCRDKYKKSSKNEVKKETVGVSL